MKKFLLFAAAALVASTASAKWVSIIESGKAADGETASIQAGWSGPAKVVDNPKGDGKVFEFQIAANEPNGDGNYDDWKSQMFICFDEPVKEGEVVKIAFDQYCTDTRNVGMQAQGDKGTYQGNFQGFEAKSEWQKYEQEVTVTEQFAGADGFKTIAICLSSKAEEATFYINNVVVEKQVEDGETPVEPGKNILASFYDGNGATLGGWGASFENVEEDGKPCIQVTVDEEKENDWNSQMAMDYDFEPGVTYYIDLEVKGTVEGSIGSGLQNSTTYAGGGNFTPFNITKEWNKQTIECTATEAGDGLPNRWTANFGKYVGTAWITNVVLYTLSEGAVDGIVAPVKVMTGVYNLQGVKVANSLDEVAAPGLYICNGKKVIKK